MTKSIKLKLLKINYSGNSIGDDIRVEIEILNQFLRIDKTIKASTTAEINKEIGKFETDQKLFKANARITIIEKDILFNDVGVVSGDVEIGTSVTKSKQFVYKIQIKEIRSVFGKFWGKKIAYFEVILEATVSDAIRYIPDEGDGWLQVRIENTKTTESLPAYLKVKVEYVKNKREYFTILEGVYRNKLASIKLKEDGVSHLISNIEHEPAVRASYSISKKVFTLNGKAYATINYENMPWEKGLYDIEIPDYPHGILGTYSEAQRPKIWFRIGHAGERYLHAGSHSLGCMTIIETAHWMEIYNVLIKARKGDFVSVGILEVVD